MSSKATRCALWLLVVIAALTATAQTERVEKPWLLDDATRIARRFDPVLAAQRAAVYETCIKNGCVGQVVVDGDLHPELMLPWELMNGLRDAFDPNPEYADHFRNLYAHRSTGLVVDAAFWERFGALARPWLEAVWEPQPPFDIPLDEIDHPRHAPRIEEGKRRQRFLCGLRADALAVARAAFGRCAFDRLLYEAVAPGRIVASRDETAESAAWMEGGCQ
jgi:hypothetical protein